ncbi:putative serine esterase-domain-containing protein [Kalaharituber pfeilii]|nr:putative serine esterase-domain-containing protein [Kalaharituber pfeilii]
MAEDTANKASHLCVLVHGLWGNPTHLEYLALAIRARYPEVYLLVCKRNAGAFTYDGIETGGERVTKEIETALDEHSRNGVEIKKLSIVGYSLGGLVARYAIGLLYSRGWFERIHPVNFTTFATPHLGVRTPLLGWHNHLWNVLGARVLSASGRQLFLIDNFRNTDRPLLSVLADKDSVFYKGLSKFSTKVLYANIVNDRSTCFYTSGISRIDPFADLEAVSVNFYPGYEPIIVDPSYPASPADKGEELPVSHRLTLATQGFAKKLPRLLLYVLFVPIVLVAFLLNALFQTITSYRRIRLHEKEGEKEGYHYYRMLPLMLVEEMQEAVECVIEDIHQMQEAEHLPSGMEESAYFGEPRMRSVSFAPLLGPQMEVNESFKLDPLGSSTLGPPKKTSVPATSNGTNTLPEKNSEQEINTKVPEVDESDDEHSENKFLLSKAVDAPQITAPPIHTPRQMEFPTLALTQCQFQMIQHLDTLGFKKYPVWIHNDAHSHAAMIVRRPWKESWAEGKIVVKHWLEETFLE